MDLRIGFLHKKKKIGVRLKGKFDIIDIYDNVRNSLSDAELIFNCFDTSPAEYDWYEKTETFYDLKKMEQIRSKYYFREEPTRLQKVGRKFGGRSNFEYWILKRTRNMDGKIYPSGDYKYKRIIKKKSSGIIRLNGSEYKNRVVLKPVSENSSFIVKDVNIGIEFHWDHKENIEYSGILEVIIDNEGTLTAVNVIGMEDYIASVNSSEMRNDNNIEMLKAQTTAARSTVAATAGKHHFGEGFDLCADDHCQCYQGIGRISKLSKTVTSETEGQVLMFGNDFVDARYSKICGGIVERYSTCWEDMELPYLRSFTDTADPQNIDTKMCDENAGEFIRNREMNCFCNTSLHQLPKSLEFCKDLFRWKETVSKNEISNNLKTKFGKDTGTILSLQILKRGYSGRIYELMVKGSEKDIVISKELNIRRLLSSSHLPSSAFIIEEEGDNFILIGAGWGHGVGMCQIGAQVMGEKGYSYTEILKHYYKGVSLQKL